MYLRKLTLTNFRVFESLTWALDSGEEAGWHVLLGSNGSGKSSFLRAAAIAFTGSIEFGAAGRPNHDFIRRAEGVNEAKVDIMVAQDRNWDDWAQGRPASNSEFEVGIVLRSNDLLQATGKYGNRTLWDSNVKGWFSAAFGPMRRFTGGNPENIRLYTSYKRLSRHLSIFHENVALTEALHWLQQLRFKQLERGSAVLPLLERVRAFVNQDDFLPYGVKLGEVTSEGVQFIDGNGVGLPVVELSDGYRAVLSMTFELIRLMADRYGESTNLFSDDGTSIRAPGVVLIDEIDAHLHPSWQREIGPWLTKHFPAVQFLVTTHSPYVCQTATKGSIWALPNPGNAEQSIRRIEGEQLQRVLYGDVLHVLNSEAFGGLPGRSSEAVDALDRLALLNMRQDTGNLTLSEDRERQGLESKLAPVVAPTSS
ncbi:MAG: AAA family ATPase [Rhizobacter sp.]